MLNLEKNKYWQEANVFSIHTISNYKTTLNQNTLDFGNRDRIVSRISGDYIMNDKERIFFSGYFSEKKTDGNNNADNQYKESINYDIFSHNKIDEKETPSSTPHDARVRGRGGDGRGGRWEI